MEENIMELNQSVTVRSDISTMKSIPDTAAPWPIDIDLNIEEINKLLSTPEGQTAFELSEFEEILKEGDFEFLKELVETGAEEESGESQKSGESESCEESDVEIVKSQSASSETSSPEEISLSDTDPPVAHHYYSGKRHIPTISVEYACEFNSVTKHAFQLTFTCGPQCQGQGHGQVQSKPVQEGLGRRGGVVPTSCHGRGDKYLKTVTSKKKRQKICSGPKKKRNKRIWGAESSRILRNSTITKSRISVSSKYTPIPESKVGKTITKEVSKYKQKKILQQQILKGQKKIGKLSNQPRGPQRRVTKDWSRRRKRPTEKEMLICKKFGINKECKISLNRLAFKLTESIGLGNESVVQNNEVIVGCRI